MRGRVKKIWNALIAYLSDWRNWLVHGLVGIGLLVVMIVIPITILAKLGVLSGVVGFNVWRMKKNKK